MALVENYAVAAWGHAGGGVPRNGRAEPVSKSTMSYAWMFAKQAK